MTVQLSSDGLWLEGEQFVGQPGSNRFAIPTNQIRVVSEAPWITVDQDNNPIVVTQIQAGQFQVNAIATFDEVMAILAPTSPPA